MHSARKPLFCLTLGICLLTGGLSAHLSAEIAADAALADGGRYYGPLVDGRLHGEGQLRWDNGARYQGGFENGLFSGNGRLEWPGGRIYEGEFRLGAMSGHGRMSFADGTVYEGQFDNGGFGGEGRLQRPDGSLYQGGFVNGEFEGQGRFQTGSGEVFEGSFVKGRFSGEGSYTDADGGRYQGRFDNWRLQGEGRYTDPGGNVYEGSFSDGQLSGPGRYTGSDGSRYSGGFQDWRYHGQGELILASGDRYQGGFRHGYYHGDGTLSFAEPRNGRSAESGPWEWGEPAERIRQAATRVERALYAQGRLLDEALAGIFEGEAGRIDMYLLAVAGDGKQEVFRREVEFVREQFDRDFGTAGRSMALINSRNTMDSAPMATRHSLDAALTTIAGRMNPAEDILFLFLTSHGSADHELTLDQNGMDIPGLPARTLGELLDKSGIKWKVVVVSACYSGGFIEHLRDPHTLVITAARADRTSFGCADENDFTYFGRAFFKEALPQSASFTDAFDKAALLVREWEEEMEQPSEPQIAGTPAIIEQLSRWLEQWRR